LGVNVGTILTDSRRDLRKEIVSWDCPPIPLIDYSGESERKKNAAKGERMLQKGGFSLGVFLSFP
jgi:hypothetical protein